MKMRLLHFKTRISALPWNLLIYFAILLSPAGMFSFQGLFRATYPLLIIFAVLNSWKAFLFVTLPILIFVPAAHFLQWTFSTPMNEGIWLIIEGSNVSEAADYLMENAVWPILAGLLIFAYWLYLYKRVKFSSPLIASKKLRYFLLALFLIPTFHVIKGRKNLLGEFNHHFTESFPYNALFSYKAAQEDLKRFREKRNFENIDELFVSHNGPDEQTVVIVLGESARRDRLELYGAPTPNNPELSKISNELFLFNDLITLHPHTVASLPVILSKQKGLHESFKFNYSFLDVFKAAGYKIFWISNQASLFGKHNLVGRFSESADFRHFFHVHSSNNPTRHDDAVLNLFKEKMSDQASKKLYVLHLQGSHYGFARRYPLSFNRFKDKYDNTLLYTDFILSEVINSLKEEGKKSMMFYVSDHGLLLNQCGKKHTHFDNKESYEVPAFLWTSKEWRAKNLDKVSNLESNLNKPLTTQVIFDSILDLADINYSNRNDKLSFVNSEVDVGERLVKTYSGIANYDLGQNDLNCHLVWEPQMITDL